MNENVIKDKIEVKFTIELLTGMHIGTSNGIAIIGAVDSVVERDPLTKKTMIPGSSLKGKMRSLLMRSEGIVDIKGSEKLARLFGDQSIKEYARLQFVDALLSDVSVEEMKNADLELQYSEIKFENTINPVTLVAKPRQIERAVRGSLFDVSLIYTISNENDIIEDFKTINKGMILLENDYIGGSGSRGYGRVKINDINLSVKNINEKVNVNVEELKDILNNR